MREIMLSILLLPVLIFAGDKTLLKPGTSAPDFTLMTQEGDSISLASFRNEKCVVLIFYPGDRTPVCTTQLCAVRDTYNDFKQRNAVVFGVNPGSGKSHKSFAEAYSLQFPLLIDKGLKVGKAYGTKRLFMQKRTVYVIDPEGIIIYAKRGKPPVEEILKALDLALGDRVIGP